MRDRRRWSLGAIVAGTVLAIAPALAGETLPAPERPLRFSAFRVDAEHLRGERAGEAVAGGGDGGYAAPVAISPDGEAIVFWAVDGVGLSFQGQRLLAAAPPQLPWPPRPCTVVWSPDVRRLALSVEGGPWVVHALDRVEPDRDDVPVVWRDPEKTPAVGRCAFSADGESLALLSARTAPDGTRATVLRRIDLRDGSEERTPLDGPFTDLLAPRPAPGTTGAPHLVLLADDHLRVIDRPGAAPRRLDLSSRGLVNADVRPDGLEALLAYRDASPEQRHVGLVRVDLVSGAVEPLDAATHVGAVWYSPDGEHAAWLARRGTAERLSVLASGAPPDAARHFELPAGAACTGVAWDPTSRRIGVTTFRETLVLDLEGGELRSVYQVWEQVNRSLSAFMHRLPAWTEAGDLVACMVDHALDDVTIPRKPRSRRR